MNNDGNDHIHEVTTPKVFLMWPTGQEVEVFLRF